MSGKQLAISEALAAVFGQTVVSGAHGATAHPLVEECAAWLAASPQFLAFFRLNAPKIRSKLRGTQDAEGLRDIAFELEIAFALLHDRRATLEYERYRAGKLRGPDFTVTFKGHLVFNVEVRRLRGPASPEKLMEVICEKLGQLPPGVANVLALGIDALPAMDQSTPPLPDVPGVVKRLVAMAENKQEEFFRRRGFVDARDFLRTFTRLSAVQLVVRAANPDATRDTLWLNPQARHSLPQDVRKLLQRPADAAMR